MAEYNILQESGDKILQENGSNILINLRTIIINEIVTISDFISKSIKKTFLETVSLTDYFITKFTNF